MSEIDKHLGKKITEFRKAIGLTQSELAELCDLTTETISRLERGVNIPSLKTLEKIAYYLKVPLKNFFDFGNKVKDLDIQREIDRLSHYLRTKEPADVKMAYDILKRIFERFECK